MRFELRGTTAEDGEGCAREGVSPAIPARTTAATIVESRTKGDENIGASTSSGSKVFRESLGVQEEDLFLLF
jgi:hypothetical protein